MHLPSHPEPRHAAIPPAWQQLVKRYQESDLKSSLWQITNTFVPFFVLWYAAYRSLEYSYLLTLLIAVVASGFMTRIFIIFHDCGHGSFFPSKRWNNWLGMFCSVFVVTPYYQWRHDHAVHHATNGDLDRRGIGDVKTYTVREYLALSRWEQFGYRVYRHPLVLLGIGPLYLFFISQRMVSSAAGRRERNGVYATNVVLALIVVGMSFWIGLVPFLLVQLPITAIAASTGVWLFYVQHQFEETYWEHHEDWQYPLAALQGSSYYRLPKVLQWFSGNIGLHHVHHLSARIPNYRLEQCHQENPPLQRVTTLTLGSSLRCILLTLWDEDEGKLVSFGHLKQRQVTVPHERIQQDEAAAG